jgi:hypothetical protein
MIGKDTMISAICWKRLFLPLAPSAGCGAFVRYPHPAVAFLTRKYKADAGIVILASQPFEYNGIIIFNSEGYTLSDSLENEIEGNILANAGTDLKTGAAWPNPDRLKRRRRLCGVFYRPAPSFPFPGLNSGDAQTALPIKRAAGCLRAWARIRTPFSTFRRRQYQRRLRSTHIEKWGHGQK